MKFLQLPNQAAARAIARAIDLELGHPTRGVHREEGLGPFVDLDGPEQLGWTLSETEVDDTVIVLTDRALGCQTVNLGGARDDDPRPPRPNQAQAKVGK